jgi:Tol biopolymer transport system component
MTPHTALPPGARLGPYEILEPIGAGGMGEVYKATDTRLDRTVAIKLLTRQWAEDSEMRQRFEREAQIIASLNHPNICVLHDIGKQDGADFLVMEYLEGETLAARLDRGPVPVEEALKMAIAIADALDKAHRRGVVHRDLKPFNVVLTASGPKLLDFGLAKREGALSLRESRRGSTRPEAGSRGAASSRSQANTMTNLTTAGAIMGTLQYMAPEQLEGTEADARTDIFAFGALVHEMITGKKAFEGKSRILLMSAIATAQPAPLSSLQPGIPAALEHLVKICMAKDPDDRWQTTRDLLAELQWIAGSGPEAIAGGAAAAAPVRAQPAKLSWVLLAAAAMLLIATALPAAMYFRGSRAEPESRIQIPLSGNAQPYDVMGGASNTARSMAGTNFAVSPDGRLLAFVSRASSPEPFALWVRPLGSVTPQKLMGIEDAAPHASQLFWSADSRFIGFVTMGKMKKIEASGGPPQDICDGAGVFGATWNREGTILFGSTTGLMRVSGEGGRPEAVTTVEQGESGHYWPHFLPDGRHYLYIAWNAEAAKRAIMMGVLGSKKRSRVSPTESMAAFAEPGFLVFHRGNAVYAQPFDWKKPALAGEPVRIADEVGYMPTSGWSDFSLSPGGVLAYFQSADAGSSPSAENSTEWQLAWADRMAKVLPDLPGPPGVYRGMEISPDGKRIAVHLHEPTGGVVQVVEPRGSVTRLTHDSTHHNSSPIWSPNGDRIAYCALVKGKWGIYQVLSSGSGTEELLYESDLLKAPMSWAPDGKRIVFWQQDPKNSGDLWILPLDGDKKPVALIATPFNETHAQISPDGKWIAYASNSTGRAEIYVQPFPTGSGRYQISFHGGDWPRWRGDSKELFYHTIATTQDAPATVGLIIGGSLLSAALSANGGVLEPESPKEIMRIWGINFPHSGGDYSTYAVSADGKRILAWQFSPTTSTLGGADTSTGADPPLSITVAMNWTSALKK